MKTGRTGIAVAAAAALACPFFGLAQSSSSSSSSGNQRIGGGVHYWKTIDQLKDDHKELDDHGISYYGSYQYVLGLIKVEVDVEVFPKNFRGSDKVSISPQAFALVGGLVYAGIGVATTWTDDDTLDKKFSDPFGILRAGVDLELLPSLHLDVNGNYQFTKWNDWDKFDTDTITLGAQARLAF